MLEDYLSSMSPVDAVALEIKIEGYLLCRLNGVKKILTIRIYMIIIIYNKEAGMQDIIDKYYKAGGICMLVQDLTSNEIEEDKFWGAFKHLYQEVDETHVLNTNKSFQSIINHHYDMAGFSMDDEEHQKYEELIDSHEEITIYRGTLGEFEHGYSWTTDKKIAIWFATRYSRLYKDKKPVVYEGRLNIMNFHCFWKKEQEVFVPPIYVEKKKLLDIG